MTQNFPAPDATRDEIDAWKRVRPDNWPMCKCGHTRGWHAPDNRGDCAMYACPCESFSEALS